MGKDIGNTLSYFNYTIFNIYLSSTQKAPFLGPFATSIFGAHPLSASRRLDLVTVEDEVHDRAKENEDDKDSHPAPRDAREREEGRGGEAVGRGGGLGRSGRDGSAGEIRAGAA